MIELKACLGSLLLLLAAPPRAGAGPASREEYKALFDRLSSEGCAACVAEGFGWSDARGRCGGFASTSCKKGAPTRAGHSAQSVPVEEDDEEDDWLEGIDEDEDEDTGGVPWKDTDLTTSLWSAISSGDQSALSTILSENSKAAAVRSKDGRGPLFWAYEYGVADMVQLLISHGADPNVKDRKGKAPGDLIGSVSGTWKREKDTNGESGNDANAAADDDLDYDPFDEIDENGDLEGYATAGVSVTETPTSRADYKELFDKLSADGCQACVASGYGWSKERARCGGFMSSTCA